MIFAVENQITEPINLGSGEGYSIKEVVKILLQKKELNFNYSYTAKRPGDISYMVADVKKLHKIYNYPIPFEKKSD